MFALLKNQGIIGSIDAMSLAGCGEDDQGHFAMWFMSHRIRHCNAYRFWYAVNEIAGYSSKQHRHHPEYMTNTVVFAVLYLVIAAIVNEAVRRITVHYARPLGQ